MQLNNSDKTGGIIRGTVCLKSDDFHIVNALAGTYNRVYSVFVLL